MYKVNIELILHQIKSKMKPEVLQQLAVEFGSPLYVYDAEKKPHSNKIEKSVNLDIASSSSQKITNAQRNLENLQKRPEKFKFDHGTNDKELI